MTWQGAVVPCPFARKQVLGLLGQRRLAEILTDSRAVQAGDAATWAQVSAEMSCHACRVTAAWLTPIAAPSLAGGAARGEAA